MLKIPQEVQEAHKEAVKALSRSHSPYSKLKVSAALKVKGVDEVICGVNVENASYGGTICAERSAICSSQSQYGSKEFSFIVVISSFDGGAIPPCGICLQFLSEFVDKDFPIYLGSEKGIEKKFLYSDLVPHPFESDMLHVEP
ncbi:MAG: cytidine deaminase [Bdellovibrionales bacterium]|nr:cytidine deaminase [Bdellovibrionales bacterium]